MHWIALSEKDTATDTLEKRLRDAAEQAAYTGLKSQEYSGGRPLRPACGVEKTDETGRLCRMVAVRKNVAVRGFEGETRQAAPTNNTHPFRSF